MYGETGDLAPGTQILPQLGSASLSLSVLHVGLQDIKSDTLLNVLCVLCYTPVPGT